MTDRLLLQAAVLKAKSESRVPDFWSEFLPSVQILSDGENPRAIPFVPYDYQTDQLRDWLNGGDHITLKARQLGYSWTVAAYMLYCAMYRGWSVAYFSRGEPEAIEQLGQRVRFIWERLTRKRDARWTTLVVRFDGGGSIRAFPGTQQGGIGYTFQLVVFDEFAAHPFGAENYAAVVPTTGAGGQVLVMSTANPTLGPAGAFYSLWRAESRFVKRFVPWNAAPTRDAAWYQEQLHRHAGDERSFRAYNPSSPEDAFAGKGLLVYPDFNEVMHVKSGQPWGEYRHRLAGVDWGGSGDPAAVVPLGVTRDERFHQPGEFLRTVSTTVDDIASYLFKLHNVAPFDIIACGVDEPVATATLRSLGLPAWPANTKRVEGIGMVSMLFRESRITIDPSCKETQHQLLTYQNRLATDPNTRERYPTKTPVDHHGDLPDAMRYAVMAYWSRSPRPQSGGRAIQFA